MKNLILAAAFVVGGMITVSAQTTPQTKTDTSTSTTNSTLNNGSLNNGTTTNGTTGTMNSTNGTTMGTMNQSSDLSTPKTDTVRLEERDATKTDRKMKKKNK